jgi:ribonuclease VapC
MVVDTSALVALLLGEPEAADIAEAFEASGPAVISAATLVEATIVVESRLGADGVLRLDQVLRAAEFETVAVDAGQARAAADAWRAFGKGRHPAALNFGDCLTYALAQHRGEPILCIGDDFARTDIDTVLRQPR